MRLFITTLSMGSVIAFGYALAGYGGALFGGGMRTDYIVLGLAFGFGLGGLALWLWYRHRDEFFIYEDEDEDEDEDHPTNAPDGTDRTGRGE